MDLQAESTRAVPVPAWGLADHSGSRAIKFALGVLDDPDPVQSGVDVEGLLFACVELVYRVTGERLKPVADPTVTGKAHEKDRPQLSREFLCSAEFCSLSGSATKILLALVTQVGSGGEGNGAVSATMSKMGVLGWNSNATLYAALKELQDAKMILCNHQRSGRQRKRYFLTMLDGAAEHSGLWRRGLPLPEVKPLTRATVRGGIRRMSAA